MVLDPAAPGTAEALSLLGVTTIAIHPGGSADTPVQPQEPKGVAGYRLVGRFPDGASVWNVVARAAPAFVTFSGGFGSPRLQDGTVVYPLLASSGVALIELRARTNGVMRLVFDATPPNTNAPQLRIEDAEGDHPLPLQGPTHVALDVYVPRGVSQLLLKVEPPPASENEAVLFSQPRVETSTAQPQLRAQPTADDPGF
jgi:hypothetical protein